jgi:hypothetical protein
MKRLVLAAVALAGAFGAINITAPQATAQTNCALVLCPPCEAGYTLSPTPGNCCRCVKS